VAGPRMPPLAMARQGDIKVSASVPLGNVAPCQSRCMRTREAQGDSRSGAREGTLLPNRGSETLARDSLRRHARTAVHRHIAGALSKIPLKSRGLTSACF
jgi:hypothetical protein